MIVDVREPDEVSLGSIPSSVNLPLSELKDALSPNFGEGDFKKVSLVPMINQSIFPIAVNSIPYPPNNQISTHLLPRQPPHSSLVRATRANAQKFAFNKPLPSQNMIFFCRSGKRSASAAEQAGKNGYGNVRNYQGSWLDWQKREKESGDDY